MLPLVATRLRIPPGAREPVPRHRLRELFDHEIPRVRLALVSAPAGYGKTTFLADWARASPHPVAWISLHPSDDDVDRFFRVLVAAWEIVHPGIMESRLATLVGGISPEREAVLAAFINEAAGRSDRTVFVLDDFHVLEAPAVSEALTFLLDQLPPNLHFILAGRGEPPLPLARYRARGEMLALRAEHLSFEPGETERFLVDHMRLELAPGAIRALHARLEGWPAGLQMVALSLRHRLTAPDRPVVTGRHRFIADYLEEEVLAPLPERVRHFLLQTSILEWLCGPLCEAVTGQAGGQEMLEALEQAELFVVPLDDRREWFRYHQLFADVLRQTLERRQPERVVELHRRAARWYLDQEWSDSAFHHALAARDVATVLRVFERYTQEKLLCGEFNVLRRWLDALPSSWRREHPLFEIAHTGLMLFTGQFEAALRSAQDVEARVAGLEGDEARRQRARVDVVRCAIACFQNDLPEAKRMAARAAAGLEDTDYMFQVILYGSLGDTYRRNAHWSEARSCYQELLDAIETPGFRFMTTSVYGGLADLEMRQGALHRAATFWQQALAASRDPAIWGRLPLPLTGWVYIRLGWLLYEWNELEEAGAHLARGLERAEAGGDVRARIAGYLLGARLHLARGDSEAAAEFLEQARPLVAGAQFDDWRGRFERLQVELWLAQGQTRKAVGWTDERLHEDDAGDETRRDVVRLALIRVLVASGRDESLRLLEPLLRRAEEEKRTGVTVEALALRALAYGVRGDVAAALTSLERALRLAEPEGYVRTFIDLGLPMARLLQQARSRTIMPGYVDALLAAFGEGVAVSATGSRVLVEPLTGREEEVLGLIARGLTNRGIAEELVISTATVKRHASNIYGKLGVGSRTEAVARARELELIE